jgi:hypothetical protein
MYWLLQQAFRDRPPGNPPYLSNITTSKMAVLEVNIEDDADHSF